MFYFVRRKNIIAIALIVLLFAVSGLGIWAGVTAMSANVPKLNLTVVIDAGHGGKDSGYESSNGTQEAAINLAIAKKLKDNFQGAGVRVVMTRQNSSGLYGLSTKNLKQKDMQARSKIINEANANLLISIHLNSFSQTSQRGAQVFYKEDDAQSLSFAGIMKAQLSGNLPASDRVILPGDYYVLNCGDLPSILIECGFLSNRDDEALLKTGDYQEKVAYNIFIGAMKYFESQDLETGIYR